MSIKDEIIEELKELRLWRGVFIAVAITLGSWLTSHIENYKNFKFIVGFIFEIIINIRILTLNKKIKEKIKLLRDL